MSATSAITALDARPTRPDTRPGRGLRVGLIAPPWAEVPPIGYGGTEAVIDQLARGLDRAGTDVVLFTVGDSTCPVPRGYILDHAEGMRIGSCVPELQHVLAAYDFMRESAVDVIHDHTIGGPVLAATPGFSDIPVVTTNHGPFNGELNDLYRRISTKMAVVAISADQASRAKGVKIARIIHHGLEPEAFPVGDGGGGYLLFLGRMAPEKGAHRAIRIANATGKRLIIAAKMREESEHNYFKTHIQEHLNERIEYVGEVAGQQKLDLMGGAEALVNPIRWPEPFGLVMIEAMACGTPVMAFRSGAAPEIVTDGVNGFLGNHEDELIEGVKRVSEIDRAQTRASVEARFTTDRMTSDHIDLYSKLARRPELKAVVGSRSGSVQTGATPFREPKRERRLKPVRMSAPGRRVPG